MTVWVIAVAWLLVRSTRNCGRLVVARGVAVVRWPYVVAGRDVSKAGGVLLCGLVVRESRLGNVVPVELCVAFVSVTSATVSGAACCDGVGGVVAVWCCWLGRLVVVVAKW